MLFVVIGVAASLLTLLKGPARELKHLQIQRIPNELVIYKSQRVARCHRVKRGFVEVIIDSWVPLIDRAGNQSRRVDEQFAEPVFGQ